MRKMNIIQLALGVMVGALCSGMALADDGAMSNVSGGSVQLMDKHPSVRMVSEAVDIKLGDNVGGEWPVFVRCQFFLKNEGPATDVSIGFPEHAEGGGEGSARGRLISFKSWVDGQQAKIRYVPSSKNKGRVDQSEEYQAWYVKKVHFDAGQTRRIVDVYSARLGIDAGVMRPTSSVLGYILRSGASWKGTIGSAVIRADLSDAVKFYGVKASPKGFVRNGNILTWKFNDLLPKEDIEVVLTPKLPIKPGQHIEYGMENPSQWEIFFVRNGVVMISPRPLVEEKGSIESHGKRLILKLHRHVLTMTAGSKEAHLDGKKIILKTAAWRPKEDDNLDYDYFAVPLDETVHLLGGSVKYDKNNVPHLNLR